MEDKYGCLNYNQADRHYVCMMQVDVMHFRVFQRCCSVDYGNFTFEGRIFGATKAFK